VRWLRVGYVFNWGMDYRRVLRMLALRDPGFFDLVGPDEAENVLVSQLEAGQAALVRLGALIALDAELVSYIHVTAVGRAAGVTNEELVGTLVAVIPDVGGDRAVSAAHKLGLAIGYDVEAALETHNHRDSHP
jgi:alkylhydroperoxidase/carboxymuconolactone decarboxylase family protein YurZ